MKNLILASSGSVHGSGYLTYLLPALKKILVGVKELLFIPYAQPGGLSYHDYTLLVKKAIKELPVSIKGIHEYHNPKEAIQNAQAIYVGGGNTFLLVKTLQDLALMNKLKESILKGTPYIGTSAGTNIAGISMQTTNDMPIVLPKSLQTLGIVPFNFNAHYVEPVQNSTHKGETRQTRIQELQHIEEINVLGLPEGTWLRIKGNDLFLRGGLEAYWFHNKEKRILSPNSRL